MLSFQSCERGRKGRRWDGEGRGRNGKEDGRGLGMERRRRGRWRERAEHEGGEVVRKRMKSVGMKKWWWGGVCGVIVLTSMKLKHVSC